MKYVVLRVMSDNDSDKIDAVVARKEDPLCKRKIKQRSGHRSHVTKVIGKVAVELPKESTTPIQQEIHAHKVSLLEKLDVLKLLDDDILEYLSDPDEIEEEIENAGEFRHKIHACLTTIESYMDDHAKPAKSTSMSPLPAATKTKTAKLSNIKIEDFHGNPLKFESFWDCFNSAVHSDDSIGKSLKFTYLRGYLKGSALAAVDGLTLTDKNYDEAVKILRDRFGNKQLLISANMKKILSIKAVCNSSNIEKIRAMFNDVEACVRNLRSLNVAQTQYGQALISIIWEKLPGDVQLVITRQMPVDKEWEIDVFLETLKKEVESREICSHMRGKGKGNGASGPQDGASGSFNSRSNDGVTEEDEFTGSTLVNNAQKITCTYCGRNHPSAQCDVITDIQARKTLLRKKAKCFLCLKSGHIAPRCKSKAKCRKCHQRHHQSICEEPNPPAGPPPPGGGDGDGVQHAHTSVTLSQNCTLLQTAKAEFGTSDTNFQEVRVLFDSCSSRSYVNQDLRDKLGLPLLKRDLMIIQAFEKEDPAPRWLDVVTGKFRGVGRDVVVEASLCLVPKICAPIACQSIELAQATYEHLIELELADRTDGCSSLKIDVLIGADFYWNFVSGQTIRGASGPVALDTVLGWVLSGLCGDSNANQVSTNLVYSSHVLRIEAQPVPVHTESADNITDDRDQKVVECVSKFWEVEDLGVSDKPSDNDVDDTEVPDIAEKISDEFKNGVTFDSDAKRYSTTLPKRCDLDILPDNYSLSASRVISTLKKLKAIPEQLKEYDNIIRTQESRGQIERVDMKENPFTVCHYLPHRGVVREDRETTKMRIVFDASAKRKGHPSLNECLETGPNMLPKIFDNLVRFRAFEIAIVSDIKEAFLNIGISEKDRDLLRFPWFDDISKDDPLMIIYRFCVLPFGLNCSPFILCAIIILHMMKYIDLNQEFVELFLRNLYMDDETGGAQNLEDAIEFYLFVRILMKEGGFELRKWQSNSSELLKAIEDNERSLGGETPLVTKTLIKVFGILWDKQNDCLMFDIKCIITDALGNEIVTKRLVLKITSSIYDPLGILAPLVIILKLIFQEVCALKCDWDTALSDEISCKWKKALSELRDAETVVLPRCYFNPHNYKSVRSFELHGFSDASKHAYAAVVYLRITLENGEVITSLVASKSKVVPLKVRCLRTEEGVPTPRLELLACLLLYKLIKTVLLSLSGVLDIAKPVYCWTDSMDCHYWITNTSKVRKRFIQSRVQKVRKNLRVDFPSGVIAQAN